MTVNNRQLLLEAVRSACDHPKTTCKVRREGGLGWKPGIQLNGILGPNQGSNPRPLLEVWSLHHWTAKEVPKPSILRELQKKRGPERGLRRVKRQGKRQQSVLS